MSYQEIVEEVKRLPFDAQLRLMEELVRAMRQQVSSSEALESATSMLAWQGILKPEDGSVPTDEEINEIIAKRLLDKYA